MIRFPRNSKLPAPPDKRIIFPHLEFGDALIVNGLVRTLAADGKETLLLTDVKYVYDVRKMYKDLGHIQVLGALGYGDVKERWMPAMPDALGLGYFSTTGFNLEKWDSEMYRQAGLSYELRWSAFRLPPSLRLPEPTVKKAIALCHEDSGRGFNIVRKMLPKEHVFITRRRLIWDWLPDILEAAELHFIDSSFLNLAESLYALGYLKNTVLVWHKYAKHYTGGGPPELRAPWRVIP